MEYRHIPGPEHYGEEDDEALEEDWGEVEAEIRAGFATKGQRPFHDEEIDEFRHGWSARRRRHRGIDWSAVEPDIRLEWEEKAEESRSWEEARDNIRRGWEHVAGKHKTEG